MRYGETIRPVVETEPSLFDPVVMVAWDGQQLGLDTYLNGWDTRLEADDLELALDTGAGDIVMRDQRGFNTKLSLSFGPEVLTSEAAAQVRQLLGDRLFEYCQAMTHALPDIGQDEQVGGFPVFDRSELTPQIQLWLELHTAAKALPESA